MSHTCSDLLLIRRGELRDLGAVSAIQAASPEAASWPPHDYLNYDLSVAVWDGNVAGFLATRVVVPGESEILNLAVAPEYRRRGLAQALMRSFLEGFRGDVFLEVRQSNSTARQFYKYLGFQEFTVRRNYYGAPPEAAIVMNFHS